MDAFLNKEEMIAFTTCHSEKGQIHWLQQHWIHHVVTPQGKPILTRSCLDVIREQGWRKKIFLTKTEALKCASMPRRGIGIYFLIGNKEIIYVGRTTNFFVRMAAHDKGEIPFDAVSFHPMDKALLDIFESEYIRRFKPKYNVSLTVKETG